MAKNLYTYPGKKDGYRKRKTKISDHPPPNISGQNIGEKINIYTQAKRMVISGRKGKKYKPPPMLPKI